MSGYTPLPSPPPTPLPGAWRFSDIVAPTEWIENYAPGGYHPVHLGDSFDGGRYRVLGKLGYGAFATVWLAKDESQHTYIALKILLASDSSEPSKDVTMVHQLENNPIWCNHIVALFGHFWHDGPNGRHLCLVFEPMGPSTMTMASELCIQPRQVERTQRYRAWMAKDILRQALKGLDFLHNSGATHADSQPGNLLFGIREELHSAPEERLIQGRAKEEVTEPVRRKDDKEDKWAPKYLALDQSLIEYTEVKPGFVVKISDFGGDFNSATPPSKTLNTPFAFRAPELLLPTPSSPFTTKIDIWAFGCLAFEFLTGFPLFNQLRFGMLREDLDNLILQMIEKLVYLPREVFERWENSRQYFGPEGVQQMWEIIDQVMGGEGEENSSEDEFTDAEDFTEYDIVPVSHSLPDIT